MWLCREHSETFEHIYHVVVNHQDMLIKLRLLKRSNELIRIIFTEVHPLSVGKTIMSQPFLCDGTALLLTACDVNNSPILSQPLYSYYCTSSGYSIAL